MNFFEFLESINDKYECAYNCYLSGKYEEEISFIDQALGMKIAFLIFFGNKYELVRSEDYKYIHYSVKSVE